MASTEQLRTAQEERILLSKFEQEAIRLKDPKLIANRMAQVTSQLCQSPTLFFVFHEGIQAAILQADGGFPKGESPAGMSFAVDQQVITRIQMADKQGEIASLADYPPLAKILLSRMGVAHFEAWAVTGYGHLGRQAGRPRLLGILVILQAGVDSATRQDSLSRMMRTTGLVYENALLTR